MIGELCKSDYLSYIEESIDSSIPLLKEYSLKGNFGRIFNLKYINEGKEEYLPITIKRKGLFVSELRTLDKLLFKGGYICTDKTSLKILLSDNCCNIIGRLLISAGCTQTLIIKETDEYKVLIRDIKGLRDG